MSKILKLKVSILTALIILISNPVWFLWDIRFHIVIFLVFLLALCLFPRIKKGNNLLLMIKKTPVTGVFFMYFVVISSIIGGFQTYLLISAIIIFLHPLLTEKEKNKALKIVTKILSFIIIVSLIPWIIHTFIYKLPMIGGYIEYYDTKGMNSVIENYILFIQVEHDFLIRFYSVFDEPGTLGTLSAFVLFGNNYNFKNKNNIIILLGTLPTFSIAFYILFILGLFIYSFNRLKRIIIAVLSTVTLSIIFYFLFNETETFKVSVIEKIQNIGASIQNRDSYYLDSYYDFFINTPQALFGKGRSFLLSEAPIFTGQSYKFFIIEFGFVGLLLVFMVYLNLTKKKGIVHIGCLVLFFASFIQRPFILQPWQFLLFIIIGTSVLTRKKNIENA
ncbi:MAG: hypothetical protein ACK5H1_08570 [Tenacibaculum sp.]